LPNKRQRNASSNCTQGTPAGLPCGMPGIGERFDGGVQPPPHNGRQAKDGVLATDDGRAGADMPSV
jgi:hypothetical protein